MSNLICLLVGLLLGGLTATVMLCCLQINRINKYEAELRKLLSQLNNK